MLLEQRSSLKLDLLDHVGCLTAPPSAVSAWYVRSLLLPFLMGDVWNYHMTRSEDMKILRYQDDTLTIYLKKIDPVKKTESRKFRNKTLQQTNPRNE